MPSSPLQSHPWRAGWRGTNRHPLFLLCPQPPTLLLEDLGVATGQGAVLGAGVRDPLRSCGHVELDNGWQTRQAAGTGQLRFLLCH